MKRLTSGVGLLLYTLMLATGSYGADSECNRSAAEVYREAAPSVVRVASLAIDPFSLVSRVRQGVGAGVVLQSGYVVTNAHVVYDASKILIGTDDGGIHPATIVGLDEISDLAVVKPSSGRLPAPPARLASDDSLEVGTDVLAIGHPLGMEQSLSRGIVSGTGRIIPFTPTDLPDPVVPATSRCGILARSAITGSPAISLPSATGRPPSNDCQSGWSRICRNSTISRVSFGSSTPIIFWPGTTATRTEITAIERAISSASAITRWDFVPGAGFSP